MSLSISDILKDLGTDETPIVEEKSAKAVESVAPEVPEADKIASYLESLAKPDTIIDELAKLAVLQSWVEANNIEMNKLASMPFEFQDNEKASMLKAASQLIKDLSKQNTLFVEQNEKRAQAEAIATKMASFGHINNNEVLEKVAELIEQPREELRALEKALELAKTGSVLGTLSSDKSDTGNSLLDYILS